MDILPTSTDVDQTEPAVSHRPQADSNSTSAGLSLRGSTTAPFVGDSAAAEVTHHSDRGSPPSALSTNIHSPSGGAPVSPVPRPRQSINRRRPHTHTHARARTHNIIDNLEMLRGTTERRGKGSERKEVIDGWRRVFQCYLNSKRSEENSHYVLLCLTATVL